jgi:hypothetical protein
MWFRPIRSTNRQPGRHWSNAMLVPGWDELDKSQPFVGRVMARDNVSTLDQATDAIRRHYLQNPGTPYPAQTPNFLIAQQQTRSYPDGPQSRTAAGATDRLTPAPSRRSGDDPLRLLSGSPSAALAVQRRAHLGDGGRGAGMAVGTGPSRARSSARQHTHAAERRVTADPAVVDVARARISRLSSRTSASVQ